MPTYRVTERQVWFCDYVVQASDEAQVRAKYPNDFPEEEDCEGDEFEITEIQKIEDAYECANCGRVSDRDSFDEAKNLSMRMEPGASTYTDKECPDCGALAFPHDKDAP